MSAAERRLQLVKAAIDLMTVERATPEGAGFEERSSRRPPPRPRRLWLNVPAIGSPMSGWMGDSNSSATEPMKFRVDEFLFPQGALPIPRDSRPGADPADLLTKADVGTDRVVWDQRIPLDDDIRPLSGPVLGKVPVLFSHPRAPKRQRVLAVAVQSTP